MSEHDNSFILEKEALKSNSPASGNPSFFKTRVFFCPWSIIAIFGGVLR